MSLLDRLKKASKIEFANTLNKSEIFTNKDVIQTSIPACS